MCSVGRADVFSFGANVSSFWPNVFTFEGNVSTLAGQVFSFGWGALVGDGARTEGEVPSFGKLRAGPSAGSRRTVRQASGGTDEVVDADWFDDFDVAPEIRAVSLRAA